MIDINIALYYLRDKFWNIMHNCVAHPLTPFFGFGERFHAWTYVMWNPPTDPQEGAGQR